MLEQLLSPVLDFVVLCVSQGYNVKKMAIGT